MDARIEILIIAVAVLIGLVYSFVGIITEGLNFMTLARTVLCSSPLILAAITAMSPVWLGVGFGMLTYHFSAPLPMLERVQVGMIVIIMLTVMLIFRSVLKRGSFRIMDTAGPRLMLATAAIVSARFLYDRPGSARLSESGGLGEAVGFLLAVIVFFVMARLAAENWDARRNMRVLLVLVIIGTLINYALLIPEGMLAFLFGVFSRQVWLLCPLVLAIAFRRNERRKTAGAAALVAGTIAAILLLGILSPHRSRPLFAVGIVASVSWIYGRFRKVVALVSVPAAIAVIVLAVMGLDRVPLLFTRSLSIILPISESRISSYVQVFESSPESGWSSPFRGQLYDLAWREIRQHPLAGKGFVFSSEEIAWAISRMGSTQSSVEALAVSGCYHNALIELAVFCGIPAALLLALAYQRVIRRFLRTAPRIRDPHVKIVSAGALGFAMAETGQAVMNGASYDIFFVCAALGVLHGVCVRADRESAAAPSSPVTS